MFEVKTASNIWQEIAKNTKGVNCFFIDILIQGKTKEELLKRLELVQKKIQNRNLRLSQDKCLFFQKRKNYSGNTIDEEALHKKYDK